MVVLTTECEMIYGMNIRVYIVYNTNVMYIHSRYAIITGTYFILIYQ